MPVINGVYTKDFPALGRAPIDTDIIPIAEVANQITYKTTIGAIFNAKVFGTAGRLSKFTGANTLGNSILNEIGNAIHLTNGGLSYSSFGIINPGIPGEPGVDNDSYIGSTINNDFTIRVNNTEAARFDTALRFKIANIQNATSDTDKFLVSDGGVVKYRTGSELRSDIGAGVGSVTSVGLTMPPAFSVANSPVTSSGTLEVTAIGSASQYIRGDGTLATIPSTSSGGANVNYYLNGSVAASVATYKQMANSSVIGGGTDFNLTGNGLIAQFLTDAGNPNRLLIPGGAWNFEMYFNISSSGGNSKFYVELLKYDGTTFTSIASSSAVAEEITGGTTTDLYITSLAVPETALLITDRLALRVYIVDNSGGRTVTLHTEDNTLCLVTTTFAGGIAALNGLTANTQYFATGSSGTDFNISSVLDTHTFNIPDASATARGLITTGTQTFAGIKTFSSDIIVNGVNIGRGGGAISTNTRVGSGTLLNNTTGNRNTASGHNALASNTTGFNNNANGSSALFTNTTGDSNNAIGSQSLFGNTTGYANVGLGVSAGNLNTTGFNNIFLGSDSTGESATESNRTWIGNTDTTSTWLGGNLLLGSRNNATSDKLQVTGNAKITGIITLGSTITNGTYTYTLPSATGTLALTSNLSDYLPLTGGTLTGALTITNANLNLSNAYFLSGKLVAGSNIALLGMNASDKVSIDPNGYGVVIGNTLNLGGAATLSNLAGTGSRAVLADANGLLSAPVSDVSVKENIQSIGYGLNEIVKMNPVWFDFVDDYKNYGEGRQNGNIAQEMKEIIPEAVFTTPSTGKMGINYEQLHAVYIKAIQELKAEIELLKNK